MEIIDTSKSPVRTSSFPARLGRVVQARIQRNTDLITGILDICKKNNFRMAIVTFCIGSLRQAQISWTVPSTKTKRGSERTAPYTIPGPIEFINGSGMFCPGDGTGCPVIHFHGSFCDSTGKTWSGHFFQGGNPVHSTMDVVVQELLDVKMDWVHDEEIDLELPVPSADLHK